LPVSDKWIFRIGIWLRWVSVQLPGRVISNFSSKVSRELKRHGVRGFLRRTFFYLRHFHKYAQTLTQVPLVVDKAMFKAATPVRRNIRLHPELSGVGAPVDVCLSIIIPTLNAGEEFRLLLRKLFEQKGLAELEVVVVDSGSTDETVERAREAGCRVLEIPPAEFSHSFSRNAGAAAARGDCLLFMVQDAYPIGDYWAYAMVCYLQEHSKTRVAAVSCAEFSRSDSDLFYDFMVAIHYRFLGCFEDDRIGEYRGPSRLALHSSGQLSDVACLISSALFDEYRYRGDYAEDLDLGIRLIKDGYRVAMLASVKVVHSHNRVAYYYLKRCFVDVIFQARMFDDFPYVSVTSFSGLVAGVVSVAGHLTAWWQGSDDFFHKSRAVDYINHLILHWRSSLAVLDSNSELMLGDENLDAYLRRLRARYLSERALDRAERDEAQRFIDDFLARLEHFSAFINSVYLEQDDFLHHRLRSAIIKIFAASAGSALAFMYIDRVEESDGDYEVAATIKDELMVGI